MIERAIIAHRGLSALYPENTLLAMERAIKVGAAGVEFDLQMTADSVPVVFHDVSLRRLCGRMGSLHRKNFVDLVDYPSFYPKRFGDRFVGTSIPSLAECVGLFQQHPSVLICAEIKSESIERFGVKAFVDRILELVEPVMPQVQFLSFSEQVIEYLHSLGVDQTNWVLSRVDDRARRRAEVLKPRVLTCSIKRLAKMRDQLWSGPWRWMVYQTEDPDEVLRLFELGVSYVESDDVNGLAKALPEYFNQPSHE